MTIPCGWLVSGSERSERSTHPILQAKMVTKLGNICPDARTMRRPRWVCIRPMSRSDDRDMLLLGWRVFLVTYHTVPGVFLGLECLSLEFAVFSLYCFVIYCYCDLLSLTIITITIIIINFITRIRRLLSFIIFIIIIIIHYHCYYCDSCDYYYYLLLPLLFLLLLLLLHISFVFSKHSVFISIAIRVTHARWHAHIQFGKLNRWPK